MTTRKRCLPDETGETCIGTQRLWQLTQDLYRLTFPALRGGSGCRDIPLTKKLLTMDLW